MNTYVNFPNQICSHPHNSTWWPEDQGGEETGSVEDPPSAYGLLRWLCYCCQYSPFPMNLLKSEFEKFKQYDIPTRVTQIF